MVNILVEFKYLLLIDFVLKNNLKVTVADRTSGLPMRDFFTMDFAELAVVLNLLLCYVL